MTEYLLMICIFFVIVYALIKGCSVNININVKQEFSQEDRQLLEDIFNEQGEYKDNKNDVQESLDELIKNVNSVMLGLEDDTDG